MQKIGRCFAFSFGNRAFGIQEIRKSANFFQLQWRTIQNINISPSILTPPRSFLWTHLVQSCQNKFLSTWGIQKTNQFLNLSRFPTPLRTFTYEIESFKQIPEDKIKEAANTHAGLFLEVQRGPKGEFPISGRAWRIDELRRKGFDDLHKLWYVLFKEKNMLLTELEKYKHRLMKARPSVRIRSSLRKVELSMKRISYVLIERSKLERLFSLPPNLRKGKIIDAKKRAKKEKAKLRRKAGKNNPENQPQNQEQLQKS